MRSTSPLTNLTDGRDLFLLASRLFAIEVDVPLYRALLSVHSGSAQTTDPPLIDEWTRSLDEEKAVEELSVEFCRLFVGPRPLCPPYESVQRGEATVGGRAEQRIKDFMGRHGLEVVLSPGLPVLSCDHLAVELALLHRLCDTAVPFETPAAHLAQEVAHEFVELHLLPWVPRYLYELQFVSRLAPYRTIAELTARFLTTGRSDHRHFLSTQKKGPLP